ncbi:hypothetical protein [Streptomyces sp. NPDC057509]|uniref:hypothetical protein n=1 Tax=Streptomyces sp. NPDC057509 TaxID=3346152 RepID=UPI0036BD0BA2
MRMVVAVLPAWPAFGFVREPASSWPERWIVGGLACCIRNSGPGSDLLRRRFADGRRTRKASGS